MTLHISATTGCNLGCSYCYEDPDRDRKQEWVDRQYDMDAIMGRLEEWKEKHPHETPGFHGGEPLLVRKEHLERVFEWVHETYDGQSSHIQTNGTLLDEDHVELFSRYNVNVGISCDGPAELNRERKTAGERGNPSGRATDRMTDRTLDAIQACVDNGVDVGIIVVLHETNVGTDERLEMLLDWIDELNQMGVSGHYNPAIPYEDVQTDISLSAERLKEVYLRTWEWMKAEPYRSWNPMRDFVDNLLGAQLGNCVNNRCDVMNAGAAKIVKGDGETTGCGKTWSQVGDGVPFLQGDSSDNKYNDPDGQERYEMLQKIPGAPDRPDDEPDLGGCKGCEYWNVCQGGCPSAGMNDDFRNRTWECKAVYALYERIEQDLRALLPNITLITDYPWDATLAERASSWQLDIKPFAAMDPAHDGATSSYGSATHPHGEPKGRIPDDHLPDRSWNEQVREAKATYDDEVLVIDEQSGTIHADSALRETPAPDEQDASGWQQVDRGEPATDGGDDGGDADGAEDEPTAAATESEQGDDPAATPPSTPSEPNHQGTGGD